MCLVYHICLPLYRNNKCKCILVHYYNDSHTLRNKYWKSDRRPWNYWITALLVDVSILYNCFVVNTHRKP